MSNVVSLKTCHRQTIFNRQQTHGQREQEMDWTIGMNNEILWLLVFFIDFGALLLIYKFLGKIGLFAWVAMATVIANIQVIKVIQLCGVTATLGNVLYASIFLATDILSENYSKKDAALAATIGFISMLALPILMTLSLLFTPGEGDFSQEALKTLFGVVPRVVAGSAVAYIVSQFHDVWAYHFIMKKLPSTKMLWLRNNGSTLISQLLDSLIFSTIAFYGLYPTRVFLEIVLTTYLLKAVCAVLDTPFIYLAKWMYSRKLIREH